METPEANPEPQSAPADVTPAPVPTPTAPSPAPSPPAAADTPQYASGSQVADEEAAKKRHRAKRRLSIAAGLAALFVVGFGIVTLLFGGALASYFAGPMESTTYSYAGVNYKLEFYRNSVEESANSISAFTQGGKKLLTDPPQVLASPALGSYGTGLDIFILPARPSPYLANNKCSDKPDLYAMFTVPAASGKSAAVVCSLSAAGQYQGQYLFQFAQSGITYDGFVQLFYSWSQVTASKQAAQGFTHYASLARYNQAIKTIVSSIQVK